VVTVTVVQVLDMEARVAMVTDKDLIGLIPMVDTAAIATPLLPIPRAPVP
jgi:hypothetical protein